MLNLRERDPSEYRDRNRSRRLALLGKTAADIDAKLAERDVARQNKDWAASDRIRAELLAEGVEVLDAPEGTSWRMNAV